MALAPEVRAYRTAWMREKRKRDYEKYREIERKSQARRKERLGLDGVKAYNKDANLRYFHGITLDEYREMLAEQNGVCGICGGPAVGKKGFHVDHDHATGLIRGIICHPCNQGMVAFDRVSDWGAKAAAYVARANISGRIGRNKKRGGGCGARKN